MKSGECKFGERCKYHHPIDRLAHTLLAKEVLLENVKLTLAGLPRREVSVFKYMLIKNKEDNHICCNISYGKENNC